MWLLDANMDVHLVQTLGELGVLSDIGTCRHRKSLSLLSSWALLEFAPLHTEPPELATELRPIPLRNFQLF